ncbi:MAG: oxaloacetate decarboxylase [SAR324 cluster bacterium]|nr:oxaloacetate decarboxylase [SAR324 cluster bacterium]MCZ6628646.1 oxaloacetate decarboxylase [SAR324 cluster bacterium]MCZ6646053.1 oxaloacetate decarboxylase [SAR324 cluster bacterium]MCZ6728415.1 oxaloacetate decarboxylase [SAR324 cluster bacterium]MCZ6843349.1 oxaloacetate decarboxylase [SAR324 cluster bacterium]
MKLTTKLRELINREEILVAPGTYDPMMAKIMAHVGFDAIYMTGAGVAHSTLAMPDIGLTTMTEMVERAMRIADACELPVIADADTGYGNAINVMRTVKEYERAGVAAIHIEDQEMPKRCGHFAGKTVIPKEEMMGKLKAALDTRQDPDFLIIARTDARTAVGFEEAIERGQAYAEVGADVIFVESPKSEEELAKIGQAINRPLLANMVETGLTPLLPAAELQKLGFNVVIFPGGLARFLTRQAEDFLNTLKEQGTTASYLDRMNTFQRHNELLELEKFNELSKKYAS